jgi:hypothetical protein
MPIDVSILRQQAPMQMPSLMESRARANQLMASDAQLAANALQLQRAQREEQQAQDINKLYSLPGAVSPTGELDYGVIGQAAPGMGLARLLPELNKQRLAEIKARGEAGEAGYKQAKARDEAINQRLKMYQEKYRFVTTPEAARAMHNQVHADPILQPFFNELGVDAAQGLARIEESIANGTFPQFLQEQSASLEQVRDQRYVQALNRDVDEAVKPPSTKSVVGEREGVKTEDVQAPRVNVLGGPDGQIIRIQLMADQAQREGRLDIAQKLLAQAKTMQDALLAGQPEDYRLFKLEQMDAAFKARRTELAKLRQQNVNVDLRDKTGAKFAETFATEAAKQDIALKGAAESAPKLASQSKRLISLLQRNDLITGTAADFRLNVAKALNLVGADNAETIRNTEELRAALGAQTLSAIKESGLGTGQGFTQKDLTFLENSVAGRIDFDKGSLERLADLAHRAAEESAKKWNARRKKLPADVTEAIGISEDIVVPPRKTDKGAAAPTKQGVVTIKGQEDFNKLPSGAQFKGPDGVVRVKP